VHRLKVTSGSFYGYFGSFDGFVEEFLAYWEETQTARVVQLSGAPVDPAARVHLLKELARQLPHEAEAAIRSWAHTNARVADAQLRVDDRRLEALTKVLRPAAGSRREARNLAIMGMTLMVGLQQWRSPVTRKTSTCSSTSTSCSSFPAFPKQPRRGVVGSDESNASSGTR